MESKLQEKLNEAIIEFHKISSEQIKSQIVCIPGTRNKSVEVTQNKIQSALKIICPKGSGEEGRKETVPETIEHFVNLEKLIPFFSSPKSFRTAWGLHSGVLNKYDADLLSNEGGQLIPVNREIRTFQCIQQGLELGVNKRLITAVRHSEGNFDDELDD